MNREYMLKTLEENPETIRSFGVHRLGIFGLYARGEQSEASDMEFLVEFEKKTFRNYISLYGCLEKLFERPCDLVIAEAVKPRLRKPIFEGTIYAKGF